MITTSRRNALRGSLAGMVAAIGLTTQGLNAAQADDDAALIAACERFQAIETEANHPDVCGDDLDALENRALAGLDDIEAHLPPKTDRGLRILANTALMRWLKDEDGEPDTYDAQDVLALAVIQSVITKTETTGSVPASV